MSRHSSASITSSEFFSSSNSSALISPLPSESILLKICVIDSLTPSSRRRIFSPSAVVATTSTRMPTSRFSIVKELSTMYMTKKVRSHWLPVARRASVASVTSSRMVPMTSRVSMDLPMEPKCSWIVPTTSSSVAGPWWYSLTKRMDQVKLMITSRKATQPTARMAAFMPLMIMRICGNARISFAMRVIRSRRRSLSVLSWPNGPLLPMIGTMAVSNTIMATRTESKTNHLLKKQESLLLNPRNRMMISAVK
mmetsp:Transcript_96692/g.250022  ORF Transcript_96692/g.250022 Transcript_96692/m.250022 type:complete len:252 (-) Transcript_96692:288-1043(-)